MRLYSLAESPCGPIVRDKMRFAVPDVESLCRFSLEFCPPSLRGPDGRQTACIASAAAFERNIIYVSPRLSAGTDWFERKILNVSPRLSPVVITSLRLSTGTAWSETSPPSELHSNTGSQVFGCSLVWIR